MTFDLYAINSGSDEGTWIGVTPLGSEFEIEMNTRTGKFRHRRYHAPVGEIGGSYARIEEDWVDGKPL